MINVFDFLLQDILDFLHLHKVLVRAHLLKLSIRLILNILHIFIYLEHVPPCPALLLLIALYLLREVALFLDQLHVLVAEHLDLLDLLLHLRDVRFLLLLEVALPLLNVGEELCFDAFDRCLQFQVVLGLPLAEFDAEVDFEIGFQFDFLGGEGGRELLVQGELLLLGFEDLLL